jgi:membrane protein
MTTTQPTPVAGTGSLEPAATAAGGPFAAPLAKLRRAHASLQASHRAYALLAEIVQTIRDHDPSLLAKQAAYSLLYAVPSVLIMLVSLAALVDKNTGSSVSEALRSSIAAEAPADLQPLLESLVQYALVKTSANTAIVAALLSLAIAIWGAAGGVGALIYAIHEVYDIRSTRSFFASLIVNVGLTLLDGILVIAAFLLLAFGRLALGWLPWIAAEGGLLAGILSSSPVLALALFFCSLLPLYWFGLEVPKSFRWLLPGAAVATVAMGILFAVIDLILSYANPGAAYGVAGSVLILLWTLFVLSVIVVAGAIVNAVLGKHFDHQLRAGLRNRPYETLAGKHVAVSVYR